MPLLIMAGLENQASQRGIEKAGFRQIGAFERTSRLFHLINRHRPIADGPTAGDERLAG